MLNSAQQIAEDLKAELLDDTRGPWLESTEQQYVNRIRAQSQRLQ